MSYVAHGILAQAAPQGGGMSGLIVIGVMFAIIYFMLIRPQQKQAKKHRDLLAQLKKGDDVVTNGGVLGKIYALQESVAVLEVARDVRIRVLRSQIAGLQKPDEPAAEGEAAKATEGSQPR